MTGRGITGLGITGLGVALGTEARKFIAARVVLATSLLYLAGLVAIAGGFVLAARSGNEAMLARLGPLADATPWGIYLGSAIQVSGAAGLLACGVVLAWIIGREFADGTVSGLFALPVSRAATALAKMIVYVVWTVALAVVATLVIVLAGLALGLAGWDDEATRMLVRLPVLGAFCGLIATPVALVATLGRGLLSGIATAVVLLAGAQIAVVAGSGPWFPIAAPALWAIDPTSVPVAALALVALVPLAATALTCGAWSRLQLDR
ncbi:MAG: ABC transporter permease [Pseudolysinimonas sp.]